MSATLEKPKPGLALALLLPLAIWIAFSVVAVVLFFMAFQRAEDVADDLARVPAGEAAEVDLASAGDYRIWLERPGASEEFALSATAEITGPDGEAIPARDYDTNLEYDDLSAVLTFEAPEAGTYTFTVTESGFSESTGDTQFAIGKANPVGELGKGAVFMVIVGAVGFVIALILMIILLVRRGRSKRRITQAAFGSGGYGPGGFGGPGGYPQTAGNPPAGGYPQPGGYPPPGSW